MIDDEEIIALIDEFDLLEDWEDKYRYLIEIGQNLPAIDEEERSEKTRVKGCVSQVWVSVKFQDGKMELSGDSDAHIVKGLVGLLIRLYSGKVPADILSIDPKMILKLIGLSEYLSPQRSNGLGSMIARIREQARIHL